MLHTRKVPQQVLKFSTSHSLTTYQLVKCVRKHRTDGKCCKYIDQKKMFCCFSVLLKLRKIHERQTKALVLFCMYLYCRAAQLPEYLFAAKLVCLIDFVVK